MSELTEILVKRREYKEEIKKINDEYLKIYDVYQEKYVNLMQRKEAKLISRLNDVLLEFGFEYQKKGRDKLFSKQSYYVLIRSIGEPSNIIIRNEENDEHLVMSLNLKKIFNSSIVYKAKNKDEEYKKTILLKKKVNDNFKTFIDNMTENSFLISLNATDKRIEKIGAEIFSCKLIDDFILYLIQNYLPLILLD